MISRFHIYQSYFPKHIYPNHALIVFIPDKYIDYLEQDIKIEFEEGCVIKVNNIICKKGCVIKVNNIICKIRNKTYNLDESIDYDLVNIIIN